MGHGERCRGPDGLRERGGAGEPRRGRAGAEQSREGPTAGLSHLNPWRLPAEAEGPGTAGAASVAAAAIGTGGECGALRGCGAALSPLTPPPGRAGPPCAAPIRARWAPGAKTQRGYPGLCGRSCSVTAAEVLPMCACLYICTC